MGEAAETESGTGLVRIVEAAALERGEVDGARAALVAWSGERAAVRTAEFLLAHLRNGNTRRAYARAVQRFVAWCAARGLPMPALRGPYVAAYIDELGRELAPLSAKQHLAALRHWLDALVVGHVLEASPAHAVRGPRYAQSAGKTPVLEREEARALPDSIAGDDAIAQRDKALIAARN